MIEIKKTTENDYEFLVKSESGKILLKSVPFKDKKSISKTIKSLAKDHSRIKKFERKTNFDGEFLFEVKNNKGMVIASSGFYSSEVGLENGIKNTNNRLINIPIPE